MLSKLKEKLRQWLFKNELQEITNLKNQLNTLSQNYDNAANTLREAKVDYQKAYKLSDDAQKIVNSIVDVGTDIGFRSDDHSWAVICIQGKPEYIKFMPLARKDAKDVAEFLKRFKYSNRCTDSPFGHKEMIEDLIFI